MPTVHFECTIFIIERLFLLLQKQLFNFSITLFFISFISFGKPSFSQNLMTNPEMETYTTCPALMQVISGLSAATLNGWTQPTDATSDYFNACIPLTTGFPNFMGVPDNPMGVQSAISGDGYVGFIAYNDNLGGYMEFVQNQLTTPLVAGTSYLIEINVSLAEDSQYYVDTIGGYFTTTPINTGNDTQLITPQHIVFQGTLNDTSNWMTLSTTYIATGGEEYLTIGSFTPQANLAFHTTGFGSQGLAYYYMDDVSLIEQIILSVKFVSFEANCQKDNVLLQWETASEVDNDFFTIERSIDGRHYSPIGFVSGNGTSYQNSQYSWQDNSPLKGVVYYRLKQTDFDGEISYHKKIAKVNCEEFGDMIIYPNPFEKSVTIEFPDDMLYPFEIIVSDCLGQLVYSQYVESELRSFQLELDDQIPSGSYCVKVINEKRQLINKIIKLN